MAVVGMFFVHPAVAWMTPEAKAGSYFRNFMHVSGMIAPTFMFLAGLSIAVIASRARDKGTDEGKARRRVSKRGLEILLLGYGMHLFMYTIGGAWGPFVRALKVDILHCIGLTMALIPWIAWPRRTVNYTALALTVLLPFLGVVLYRLPIGENLPTYIAGYLTSRTKYTLFPMIPYAAWMMLGLFFGPLYLKGAAEGGKRELRLWLLTAFAAAAMWFIGGGLKSVYYSLHIDTWGIDTPQVKGVPHYFWMKGAVVLLLFIVARITTGIFDRFRTQFWVFFGRHSLFSYCVHLFIIYPLAGAYLSKRLDARGHLIGSALLTATMLLLLLAQKYLAARDWRPLLARALGRGPIKEE